MKLGACFVALSFSLLASCASAAHDGDRSSSGGFLERVAQLATLSVKPNAPPHGLLFWSTKKSGASADVDSGNSGVPVGYDHHPGIGHYKFHVFGSSWCMANQICGEEGARLLVINSETEAEAVKMVMAKKPAAITGGVDNLWFWIGLHEKGQHGQFFTVQGEPLESTGFTRWEPPHPNKPPPNDCVVINRNSAGLADDNCAHLRGFICEHPGQ